MLEDVVSDARGSSPAVVTTRSRGSSRLVTGHGAAPRDCRNRTVSSSAPSRSFTT
jgi:hypothetical protein